MSDELVFSPEQTEALAFEIIGSALHGKTYEAPREIILRFSDVVFLSFSLRKVAKRQKQKSFLLFWMSFFVRTSMQ